MMQGKEKINRLNLISKTVSKDYLKRAGLLDEATGELIRYFHLHNKDGAERFISGLVTVARLMAQASITCDGEDKRGFTPELRDALRQAYINGFCDGAYNFGFARTDYQISGAEYERGSVINRAPVFIDALGEESSGSDDGAGLEDWTEDEGVADGTVFSW